MFQGHHGRTTVGPWSDRALSVRFSDLTDLSVGARLVNNDSVNQLSSQVADFEPNTVIESSIDYFIKPPLKNVEELRATIEVSAYVVKATIAKVMPYDGWFMYACKKCNKIVHPKLIEGDTGKLFDCDTCGTITSVIGKVRTVVRVQDETGSTSFVLFDRQLSKIINKSVAWTATQIEKTDDPFLLPDDFNVLLNKEMVFKIAVGEFNLRYDYSTYTLHRATDDADVMNAITKKLKDQQHQLAIEDSHETTPVDKVVDLENNCTPESSKTFTPIPFCLKRKSESPSGISTDSSYTSKSCKDIKSLEISRMEDV